MTTLPHVLVAIPVLALAAVAMPSEIRIGDVEFFAGSPVGTATARCLSDEPHWGDVARPDGSQCVLWVPDQAPDAPVQ